MSVPIPGPTWGPSRPASRVGGFRHVAAACVAGSLLVLVYSTPAAAEVCDKAWETETGLLLTTLVPMAFVSLTIAAFTGHVWPGYVAALLPLLVGSTGLFDLINGDHAAMAGWREGCEPRSSLIVLATGLCIIALGYLGRRWRSKRLGAGV